MALCRTLTSALLVLSTPAMADISADDVWANTVAYYKATGGTLSAEQTRESNSVFIDNPVLSYRLPFDLGTVRIGLPPMTMIEEADGSVTQRLPKSFDFMLDLRDTPAMGALSLNTVVTQADFVAIATGSPGDITYERSAAAFGATVEFAAGEDDIDVMELYLELSGDGYTQSTRVVEGALIEITADSTTQPMQYSFSSNESYGSRTEGSGSYDTGIGKISMALPADGVDLLNLAPALAAGMFVEGTSTTAGTYDESVTYFDETVATRDSTTVGPAQSTMRLSNEGLAGGAEAQDIAVTFEENTFTNLQVEVGLDDVSVDYRIPLMAADEPQEQVLNLQLSGLMLNDGTWDMFDPDGAIPRDPAHLRINSSSTIMLGVDLVNFLALEDAFSGSEMPIGIETARLDAFELSAAGTSATGSGAFTFDNTDLDTFDGLPRPEGSGVIEVSGANALLDNLIAAGLVPQSEAGMGRMMLGMFTRPTGDDQLTSTLDITPEGEVLVNGERIR